MYRKSSATGIWVKALGLSHPLKNMAHNFNATLDQVFGVAKQTRAYSKVRWIHQANSVRPIESRDSSRTKSTPCGILKP